MANKYSRYLAVTPNILRAGAGKKEITIHLRQTHVRKVLDAIQELRICRVDGPLTLYTRWQAETPPTAFRRLENGDLVFEMETPFEGEYAICAGIPEADGKFRELVHFSVYALRDDLFALTPYKGDFHMHSNCSDGQETPAYVAATCRRTGYDFMALTDHRQYAPSLTARKAMADFGCDMLTCPGEEVHLPDDPVHIINFGGKSSVNDLAYNNEAKYRAEVAGYMDAVPKDFDPRTRFQVAASEWAFDRIREAGGIAMFCHPFWRPIHHNYIGEDVIDLLLERNKFDVLEVIGGFYRQDVESNMLSVSRWQEELAKGRTIPAAGISDSHGCDGDLTGWYYTVVFAEDLSFDAIAAAIRANRCAAVHYIPGTYPVVAGPFRLTKLIFFLLREVFPAHDELCRVEGDIMRRALAGAEPDAKEELARRRGAVRRYMETCWER